MAILVLLTTTVAVGAAQKIIQNLHGRHLQDLKVNKKIIIMLTYGWWRCNIFVIRAEWTFHLHMY